MARTPQEIAALLQSHEKGVSIDLGCGAHKQDGFLGVDMLDLPGVDVVHNLCVFPWPLPDECASLVMASHLIEHINPTCFDPRFGLLVQLLVGKKILTAEEVRLAIGETDSPPVFLRFMDEIWRLLKPGGKFMIAFPHGRSEGFMQDPTHVACRNQNTWLYFDPLHPSDPQGTLYSFYRPKPWKIEHNSYFETGNCEVVLSKRIQQTKYAS